MKINLFVQENYHPFACNFIFLIGQLVYYYYVIFSLVFSHWPAYTLLLCRLLCCFLIGRIIYYCYVVCIVDGMIVDLALLRLKHSIVEGPLVYVRS